MVIVLAKHDYCCVCETVKGLDYGNVNAETSIRRGLLSMCRIHILGTDLVDLFSPYYWRRVARPFDLSP